MLSNNLDYTQYVLVTSTMAAAGLFVILGMCVLPKQLAKGFSSPSVGIGY
jgi:hypothetical protein